MEHSARIEMIPIDAIAVINPRARNGKVHREITDNIEQVGLKRPITVRRTPPGATTQYALICGQGRLESCQMLGQTEIPAVIVDTDEETGHVMSIVENVARRLPRANETLEQVGTLRKRGYSDSQISEKIGCTASWINGVGSLLDRGEKRLLAATEAGHIPLHLAILISRASGNEAQNILMEAYERGDLKGKKISIVRRILEQRLRSGKQSRNDFAKTGARRHMSSEDLTKLYQRDTANHRLIQKKAERTNGALLLAEEIFKELFSDRDFCAVLRSEKLTNVPQPLADIAHRGGFLR